jgi:probable HAF family extracellular repeat protein
MAEILYNITDLGNLGGPLTIPYAINDNGQVVGVSDIAGGQDRAFLWDSTNGMTNLGTLGGDSSEALGINNNGQVVGSARNPVPNFRAFLWENETMSDLGTLGADWSRAYDINNNGQVVGYTSGDAFFWDSVGGMIDIGHLGGNYSWARAINDAGQAVGFSRNSNGKDRAFLWENGTMSDLGAMADSASGAYDINNSGQIVGGSGVGLPEQCRAILWDGVNGMVDLGGLGGDSGNAHGINDNGQIVGWSENSDYNGRAFVWDEGTMYELSTLIPPDSGWDYLSIAYDINNTGQIVGTGRIDGVIHPFILTPIPEPATLILFALGGLMLRKRK